MRISDWSSDVCSSDLLEPRQLGAWAVAIAEGLEDLAHRHIACEPVMRRRGVAAVEAVTRRKVAAHHYEAGGGLDAESPKQDGIDPERLGGIIALPDRRQRSLELCTLPCREPAQPAHPTFPPRTANHPFERP